MTAIHAARALLSGGWADRVRVEIDGSGRIASVAAGVEPKAGDMRLNTRALLPAASNLHSHAFQRAMAGMTERRAAGRDDFWSWRELMYRFLDVLTPEQVEAIAALVHVEMLEAGYAASAEFHYLHHRPGGSAYSDLAEMSARIAAAAEATGIGLTLLPVLYTYGGAGKAALRGGQLRFGSDLDRFTRLMEGARAAMAQLSPDCTLGIAPHSLRATAPDELAEVVGRFPEGPVHIHAAEQVKEVDDVVAWLGARPVEYLLAEHGVGDRWCLIHCTQMTPSETAALAASGAVAGLCPLTEGNLGDGIFDGAAYLAAGGRFGVGSDSNIRITLSGELSQLEYSQRLRDRARNVMTTDGASTGATLYRRTLAGGARALGRASGEIRAGLWADLVAVDRSHIGLAGLTDAQLLDGWIFAAGDGVVGDVWSAGRHVVRGGQHVAREAVEARYRSAISTLLDAI
jgi:formiminoglutamate deiminase